jgi:MarR family transcriptional regulator, organic hydroperoxide resistance regulator
MPTQSSAEELIDLLIQLTHIPAHDNAEQVARGEGALLAHLALRHDGASAGELRTALDVGSSRVANALKNLEAKGLITRENSEEDGRVVQVFLTPLGRQYILSRYQQLRQQAGRVVEAMGEDDTAEFLRLSRKLVCTIQQLHQQPH